MALPPQRYARDRIIAERPAERPARALPARALVAGLGMTLAAGVLVVALPVVARISTPQRSGAVGGVGTAAARPTPTAVPSAGASTAATGRKHGGTAKHASKPSRAARRRLTRALQAYLALRGGRLSVAIHDSASGATFSYGASQAYPTASIVKVNVLAALLLRAQRAGRSLTAMERGLAEAMITRSDNASTTALWRDIQGASGLNAANRTFGLRRTVAGTDGYWGLTRTCTADQLRLLAGLTSSRSPLRAAARAYALGLMRRVVDGQDWGVSAAADGDDTVALKNGWLPRAADDGTWVINSIGVISGTGHHYLVAVLSDHDRSMESGVTTVEKVAELVAEAFG